MFYKESMNIGVGELVIINQFDKPCSRLIAVVTEVTEKHVHAKYLSASTKMVDIFSPIGRATPVGVFGVRVQLEAGMFAGIAHKVSAATYPDGSARPWQEDYNDHAQLLRGEVDLDLTTWERL